MKGDKLSSVGVIGAGIQGVCTSLNLINKGFKVKRYDGDKKLIESKAQIKLRK